MAFVISDFKRTSRTAEGRRILYPHQLRDDRYVAAIGYALDYFERMVGQPRREMQADTLLEFFGDPKLARGIVACLSRTYVWHQPTFEETVDGATYTALRELGLERPSSARAHLYSWVNRTSGGFVPLSGRTTVLDELCSELPVDRRMLETLLTLDVPENAVLLKLAGTPTAREIVALYNYHSIETALRYTSRLRLTLDGPIWSVVRTVHNLSKRYKLRYAIEHGAGGLFAGQVTIEWIGKRDALGGYGRHGRRVVRALLRLLAAHPDAPVAGEATVHVAGKTYSYPLTVATLKTLGVQAQRVGRGDTAWEPESAKTLMSAWNRAYLRGETGGWRLRRDPEPLVTEAGVIVPDFLALRGAQRAYLVLAEGKAAADALVKPLRALGGRSLIVVAVEADWARPLASLPVVVVPHAGQPVARMLARALPAPAAASSFGESKWQRLQRVLEAESFVDESRVAELLEVRPDQVATSLRDWRRDEATYLPGIGLCTAQTMDELKSLLQSGELRKAA